MTVLEIRDLVVAYGPVVALHSVDLDVHEGETVAVVGPNGAGKTSLTRCLARLVKQRRGRIGFDGRDVGRHRPSRMARAGLSLVPEGRGVLAPLTVKDNLALGGHGLSAVEARERAAEMRELFPVLERRADSPAGLLSGGEQQMLAIARALMSRPKLLALDEPSMGLAPLVVEQILETLQTVASRGTAILLAEQNAALALDVADRVLVLVQGEIVAAGAGQELGADLFERYLA